MRSVRDVTDAILSGASMGPQEYALAERYERDAARWARSIRPHGFHRVVAKPKSERPAMWARRTPKAGGTSPPNNPSR